MLLDSHHRTICQAFGIVFHGEQLTEPAIIANDSRDERYIHYYMDNASSFIYRVVFCNVQ